MLSGAHERAAEGLRGHSCCPRASVELFPHTSVPYAPAPRALAPGAAPQIPDIYDSAKYDANHNDHLNLNLRVRVCCTHSRPKQARMHVVGTMLHRLHLARCPALHAMPVPALHATLHRLHLTPCPACMPCQSPRAAVARHSAPSATAHCAAPFVRPLRVRACMQELYIVSRQLATAVIPNEYGIDPQGKLRIGSRIATEVRLSTLPQGCARAHCRRAAPCALPHCQGVCACSLPRGGTPHAFVSPHRCVRHALPAFALAMVLAAVGRMRCIVRMPWHTSALSATALLWPYAVKATSAIVLPFRRVHPHLCIIALSCLAHKLCCASCSCCWACVRACAPACVHVRVRLCVCVCACAPHS